MEDQSLTFIAKTFSGLERVLSDELACLGAKDIKQTKRAVEFTGGVELLYKANYWSRTAINILKLINIFEVNTQQDLYDGLKQIKWDQYFDHSKTISVNAIIFDTVFDNSHFVALRSKDAIVDYFSETLGKRPNVDTSDPDIKIAIHLSKNICKVSVDSSGQPLFKRGYRRLAGEAPLNEVLAAGLIKLARWDSNTPLIDPMCGSATIPIEATMMAQNIPPAFLRKNFAFQNWKHYDPELFEKIKKQAMDSAKSGIKIKIEGHDINGKIIGVARKNIMTAGLLGTIHLQRSDFFTCKPKENSGMLIFNPPYGKRLKKDHIIDFYKNIGDTLKTKYKGYSAWIFSQDDYPLTFIGLRPSDKKYLYNGPLECKFQKYEIYDGSLKTKNEVNKKHQTN